MHAMQMFLISGGCQHIEHGHAIMQTVSLNPSLPNLSVHACLDADEKDRPFEIQWLK